MHTVLRALNEKEIEMLEPEISHLRALVQRAEMVRAHHAQLIEDQRLRLIRAAVALTGQEGASLRVETMELLVPDENGTDEPDFDMVRKGDV